MKISFVIPAHNEEALLPSCIYAIKSELARTKITSEIIVVNNASTDSTESVAKNIPGVIVVNEPKKGLPYARHAGFLASKGMLIANIDADTKIKKGWIKKVIHEFDKNPRLVALSGPYIYHDLPKYTRILVAAFYTLAFFLYLANRFILNSGSLLQGGNFAVRRSALKKIGGYDTNIVFYGEDADAARRLHKVGGVKFTPLLQAYSSGRRLAKEGVLKIGMRYAMNYFWIIFLKKPYTTSHPISHSAKKN